jgi:predicted DNA repair protein MutK
VFKGSMLNKAILVPAALAISALAPWAITPLLMLGGAYLCFEGFEKVAHALRRESAEEAAHHAELTAALMDPETDLLALERSKIKGAIRTDFILSAEIIAITLGVVAESSFGVRLGVLCGIALVMTIGVYGLVAGIVKLDDAGLYLSQRQGEAIAARALRHLGNAILSAAPYLMRTLSVAGTVAMFLVGGGILVHGTPGAEALIHRIGEALAAGGAIAAGLPLVANLVVGLVVGAAVLIAVSAAGRLRRTAVSS